MKAFQQTIPTGIKRIGVDQNTTAAINGDGGNIDVDVAILDSGVDEDHPDLNVVGGVRFYTINTGPPSRRGSNEDNNYNDDNGHGTHVAGTVAAIDNEIGVVGVAPGARIWAVKILDASGSGYLSDIIAGIDWVVAKSKDIEVINMSLGGQGRSSAYQAAIQSAVNAGVVVVVAAGNEEMDVYGPDQTFNTNDDIIPAAYPEAATISALADSDGLPGGLGGVTSYDPDDSFASGFSNFSNNVVSGNPVISSGKAIDLMLPGVDITSTYLNGQYAIGSGTSMASPHAAGLVALYIAENQRANDAQGVYAIRQALIDGGVAQQDEKGLVNLNDPDGNEENIGWAGLTQSGNLSPKAIAGPDKTYVEGELITLDGSGSYDSDGSIVTYEWSEGTTILGTEAIINPTLSLGVHTITLTVTDNEGAVGTDDVLIIVVEASTNQDPVAAFSYTTADLTALFTDQSTDPDGGTITSWDWDFGDGKSSTDQNPSYTYASGGTYTVTLTVTDNIGATSSISQDVSVSASSGNEDPTVTINIVNTSNPAFKRVQVNWSAQDNDGDLATITSVLSGPGSDSATSTISGDSESGTHELSVKRGASGWYKVTTTVTDLAGNSATTEQNIEL